MGDLNPFLLGMCCWALVIQSLPHYIYFVGNWRFLLGTSNFDHGILKGFVG